MKFKSFVNNLNTKKAGLAVLVDPDKFSPELITLANKNRVSCFLVGGSKLKKHNLKSTVQKIKQLSSLPVIIFPGDEKQICKEADGLFVLSLLSGRNPEYLIEKHVNAANAIKKSKLSSLPVAYILLSGGKVSTTQKVSRTKPIDIKNNVLIKNTCIAGELLGFKAIYLEAGSGAKNAIPMQVIKAVKKEIQIPLIVGGGIDSYRKANNAIMAGANLVVVGNALERNKDLITEIGKAFI